jgi:NTE family protein
MNTNQKTQAKLAFVLGGGGARGALQVGALRALLEAGYQPRLLVGTSIGAANASFLAIHGVNLENVERLADVYRHAADHNLLPSNYLWLSLRALLNRPNAQTLNRVKDFFIKHSITPEQRFRDIQGVQLLIVATDINNACKVVFGYEPDGLIIDALQASTALPPWVAPIEQNGQMIIDGGVISNLPIETALENDATEIIALDITDTRESNSADYGFGAFFGKLSSTIQQRQIELESSLATARHVPVRKIHLKSHGQVPIWDFSHWDELIAEGYSITVEEIKKWVPEKRPKFWQILSDVYRELHR